MRAIWLLVALGACGGGNYCQRSQKLAEDCGETVPDDAIAQCEESLQSCDGHDRKLLDESLDCFVDLGLFECEDEDAAGAAMSSTGTGTGGTTTGFEDFADLLACVGPLADLSPECAAAMDTTGSSTVSATFTGSGTM